MASFIAPIVGGLLGGLGGLFGGGKQQQQATHQTSSGTQDFSGTATTTPNLSPIALMLQKLMGQGAANLYNQGTDLSGYTAGGLRNINQGAEAGTKNIQDILASRGLSYSPAAAAPLAQNEISRIGQGTNFLQQIPLLARQLQEQSLGDLTNTFRAMPYGSTSTSSGTQHSTGTTDANGAISGNPLGGLFSGFGAGASAGGLFDILGQLFGKKPGNSSVVGPGDPSYGA